MIFVLFGVVIPDVFEGLTLITAKNNPNVLLVNNELEIVNSWNNDTSPYSIAYLKQDLIYKIKAM